MKKILIIDDDVIIRITLNKLLKTSSHIIKQAKDVSEAIESMKKEIFDLVLLDIKLPPSGWEGGFQVLNRKRKIGLNSATPVIIVTGAPNEDFVNEKITLEDNVAHILLKPVDNDVLLEKVEHVLGRSHPKS